MGTPDVDRVVYECQHCGNVSLGNPASSSSGEEVTAEAGAPVRQPELAVVLREVFGISETGLTICICLVEAREATAGDLAERLDLDRSTASRQLNHLTDLGLLEKRQRLLSDGGYVNVFSPVAVEEVRRRLTVGLHAWLDDALELVENVDREKMNALARADLSDGGTTGIYWDE